VDCRRVFWDQKLSATEFFLSFFPSQRSTSPEDGAMVRFISALVAPVVPLAVMLCCMLLELLKPGSGINAGLQAQQLMTHCFSLFFSIFSAGFGKPCQILVFDSGD